MNRGEIRSRILEALNDSVTSPQLYTTAQLNDIINDAGETIAEEAKLIRRSVDLTLRPGHTFYYTRSLGANVLVPMRLWIPSLNRRLQACSESNLDDFRERPHQVMDTPWYWFPLSWDMFGVWPTSSTGGELLRMDYIAWPSPLNEDTDSPEMSEAEQTAYYLYGVLDGLLKRWDYERAIVAFTKFMELVGGATFTASMQSFQQRLYQSGSAGTPGFPSEMGARYGAGQ
jgi:hypothetical protein